MASNIENGILKIKNVSGSDYVIEELGGHVLADQAELDLLDTALPSFYGSYRDAERCLFESPNCSLCQDIDAGNLQVVENRKPVKLRGDS